MDPATTGALRPALSALRDHSPPDAACLRRCHHACGDTAGAERRSRRAECQATIRFATASLDSPATTSKGAYRCASPETLNHHHISFLPPARASAEHM